MAEKTKLPRLMTPAEVCEYLQISKPSFYKHVYLGQLPVIKIGATLRVDRNRLDKFLESRSR